MRIKINDSDLSHSRVKHGRARVVGLGLDDSHGHLRYTRGEAFELYGGSETAHDEMQRRARRILDEVAKLGISFDRMTYEQFEQLRDIVERVNCE